MPAKSDEFWSVEVGTRMGPFVLGAEYEPLLEALRESDIDVERLRLDRFGKLLLPELGIQLVFSPAGPRTLDRIDVSDDRLRFGSLSVIGKRAHEIVGLFKVPRKGTLWSNIESEGQSPERTAKGKTLEQSRELLARGTIWITAIGLGLTLRDGLVATVHLCDPAQSPRSGSGPWTKEQQLLSEVREIPPASMLSTEDNRQRKSILNAVVHLALVASIGILISWAIQLQRRWDAAAEVTALVVALKPPPPNVLPDRITVSYNDPDGLEHRHTLGFMQFMTTPKMGDEVKVRFLPESPNNVLGPVAWRDVGFDSAFPYGIGILAIYSTVQLVLFGIPAIGRLRAART